MYKEFMKRIALGVLIAVAAVTGSASAKGHVEQIGISGPGLRGELRIGATGIDLALRWGALQRASRDMFYTVTVYARFPNGPLSPTTPMFYYPFSAGKPAVIRLGEGAHYFDWKYPRASLANRLDAAIQAGLAGRTSAFDKPIITSWPYFALDLAAILSITSVITFARRRFRIARMPAPEARA